MPPEVAISPDEQRRLNRILAVTDVESQRAVAYWYWGMAAVLCVTGHVAVLWSLAWFVVLVPTASVALMIGCSRYGYYKLHRLIHYQHALLELSKESNATAPG